MPTTLGASRAMARNSSNVMMGYFPEIRKGTSLVKCFHKSRKERVANRCIAGPEKHISVLSVVSLVL